MGILVDRSKCVSLGMCEAVSEAFEIDDDGELIVHDKLAAAAPRQEIEDAIKSCPVKALSWAD